MILFICGIIFMVLSYIFNKIGDSYIPQDVDPAEYYKASHVVYPVGYFVTCLGFIEIVFRYVNNL